MDNKIPEQLTETAVDSPEIAQAKLWWARSSTPPSPISGGFCGTHFMDQIKSAYREIERSAKPYSAEPQGNYRKACELADLGHDVDCCQECSAFSMSPYSAPAGWCRKYDSWQVNTVVNWVCDEFERKDGVRAVRVQRTGDPKDTTVKVEYKEDGSCIIWAPEVSWSDFSPEERQNPYASYFKKYPEYIAAVIKVLPKKRRCKTRKRYVKLLMADGYSRNEAQEAAKDFLERKGDPEWSFLGSYQMAYLYSRIMRPELESCYPRDDLLNYCPAVAHGYQTIKLGRNFDGI